MTGGREPSSINSIICVLTTPYEVSDCIHSELMPRSPFLFIYYLFDSVWAQKEAIYMYLATHPQDIRDIEISWHRHTDTKIIKGESSHAARVKRYVLSCHAIGFEKWDHLAHFSKKKKLITHNFQLWLRKWVWLFSQYHVTFTDNFAPT